MIVGRGRMIRVRFSIVTTKHELNEHFGSLPYLKHCLFSVTGKQNITLSSWEPNLYVPHAPFSNAFGSSPIRSKLQPIILLILISNMIFFSVKYSNAEPVSYHRNFHRIQAFVHLKLSSTTCKHL